MNETHRGRYTPLAVLALGGISLAWFAMHSPTAFEWPAIDMGPMLERARDPDFLRNDFFVNASAQPNSRMVFGWILSALAWLTRQDWYGAVFFMKVALVLLLPGMLFVVLRDLSTRDLQRGHAIVSWAVFVWIALVLAWTTLAQRLSVAWFPVLSFQSTPSNLSLLLFLTGAVLGRTRARLGLAFWFASTVIHPATGPFGIVFFETATLERGSWRRSAVQLGVGALLPALIVAIAFRPPESLSAAEFVHHYAWVRHPWHYVPRLFGSLSGIPWYRTVSTVAMLLLAGAAISWRLGMRRLAVATVAFAGTYVGAVVAQWFTIEVRPIKLLAALGPIRYCMFGPWMLAVAYAPLLARLGGQLADRFPAFSQRVARMSPLPAWSRARESALIRWPGIALMLCLTVVVGFAVTKDEPIATTRGKAPALFAWLATTPSDAVFAAPPNDLPSTIVLVARRAVLVGDGFPFREDFFREHTARWIALYGMAATREDGRAQNLDRFYRELKPADFVAVSQRFRCDYVVVDTTDSAFSGRTPVFRGDGVAVYRIADLTP